MTSSTSCQPARRFLFRGLAALIFHLAAIEAHRHDASSRGRSSQATEATLRHPLTSSKMTFFYKRIFPVIWFGLLAVFFLISLPKVLGLDLNLPLRPVIKGLGPDQTSNLPFLIVPVLMAIFSYPFLKKFMFNLVDEVFDDGDALIVPNGGREARIALADIKNVNYFPYMSPPQVTLSLRRPTVFGDTIVFCAPVRIIPMSSSPIIDKLIERIDAARQRH